MDLGVGDSGLPGISNKEVEELKKAAEKQVRAPKAPATPAQDTAGADVLKQKDIQKLERAMNASRDDLLEISKKFIYISSDRKDLSKQVCILFHYNRRNG